MAPTAMNAIRMGSSTLGPSGGEALEEAAEAEAAVEDVEAREAKSHARTIPSTIATTTKPTTHLGNGRAPRRSQSPLPALETVAMQQCRGRKKGAKRDRTARTPRSKALVWMGAEKKNSEAWPSKFGMHCFVSSRPSFASSLYTT